MIDPPFEGRRSTIAIVVDHPRRYPLRRTWRRVRAVIGGLLVAVGLTASIVAVPASLAVLGVVLGWATTEPGDPDRFPSPDVPVREIVIAWAVAAPMAVAGIRGGLRLLRRGRTLVLFLRRFGFDDAQDAVAFAVLQTIGASWRVVTLDDEEMAPIGVPTGARWAFAAGTTAAKRLAATAHFLGVRMFPTLVLAGWGVVAIAALDPALEYARTGTPQWDRLPVTFGPFFEILGDLFELRLPLAAMRPDLPGLFAVIGTAAVLSFLVMMATMAALLLALPLSTVLFFIGSSAGAVREAEQSKRAAVRTAREIGQAAAAIARRSRKVFGPRLVILRVASPVWQLAVTELASVSSLTIIDVSEPTVNVLWEVEELTRRFGGRCVFIGQHDRVASLAAGPPDGRAPGPVEERIAALLEGREVLAYTADRRGLKRFAKALRGVLLSRHPD